MKLTLRKASAIQKLINEEINATNLVLTVSIGRFDSPVTKRNEAADKLNENTVKKDKLLKSLYAIRKLVSAAGQAAGISDILADVAYIDKVTGVIKPLAGTDKFAVDGDVLKAQHDDLTQEKTPTDRYSGRREAFETSTIYEGSASACKETVGQLRKEKQALSDKLLELNVRTEITLEAATVETLKTYGII